MLLFKIAFRNLWRRTFRTLITVGVLGFSYGLLIFFIHFHDGSHEQMANTGIRMRAGHVVVEHKAYGLERELERSIKDPKRVEERIKSIDPEAHVAFRIFTTGSLRTSEGSVLLDSLVGVEHHRESEISDFPRKLVRGRFLSGQGGEIVIGAVAARLLQVEPGEKVQISVSDVGGTIQRASLQVAGVFRTGTTMVDRAYALVDLHALQTILLMEGEATQVAVFSTLDGSRSLARSIARALPEYRTLHWEEAMEGLHQLLLVDTASMYVFLIIIFFIVAAGIMNTVLMSVLGRTREFGVLKSLGMGPGPLFRLILLEALLMGLFAVFVGLLVGLFSSWLLSLYGLNPALIAGNSNLEVGGVPMMDRLFPKITIWSCVWTAGVTLLITLLSALPPALRAARIIPVKAMRG